MGWWEPRTIEEGGSAAWRLGPLWLRATRQGRLVLVEWARHGDPLDPAIEVDPTPPEGLSWQLQRLVTRSDRPDVCLRPRLADRHYVFRPEWAHRLPVGTSFDAFVTSPLWVGVEADGASLELPTLRPTDSWFGTPLEGRLCYASRTLLRARLDSLPDIPHRATTPLTVRNEGRNELVLERLSLPVPSLGLWRSAGGRFWTDAITLVLTDDPDRAHVRIGTGAPAAAPGAVRVAPPREPQVGSSVLRVFNSFFGLSEPP